MKKILNLVFVSFLLYNSPLFAMPGLFEEGEFLNLHNICVVSTAGGTNLTPGGRQRPGTSIDEIVETHIVPHRNLLSKVRVIDLSLNNMPTEVLANFVRALETRGLWQLFQSVELILLSDNNIRSDTAPILVRFLELNKQEGMSSIFPYLNIVRTPSENKDVRTLSQALKGENKKPHEVPSLMGHLIFLKRNYLKFASDQVQVYRDMVRSFDLPNTWSKTHDAYYASQVLRDLRRFRKGLKGELLRSFVRDSLRDPTQQSGADVTEDDIAAIAELVGNLSLKSPKHTQE